MKNQKNVKNSGIKKGLDRRKDRQVQSRAPGKSNPKKPKAERELSENNVDFQDNGSINDGIFYKTKTFTDSEISSLKNEIRELLSESEEKTRQRFINNYEKGIEHLNRGSYKKAISNFEEALRIYPQHYYAQRYLIEAITENTKLQEMMSLKASDMKKAKSLTS